MKLRILGSAGAEFPDFRPPAFLIDDALLLDAGTIGSVLTEDEQWQLRHIFVTHSHLDHIRGIPALADNVIIKNMQHLVTVYATSQVITAMREHVLNNIIWPDFTRLPNAENPVLQYEVIKTGTPLKVNGYTLTAIEVTHTVPAVGYVVDCDSKRLVYTGDTGPTEEIWQYASGCNALIVEVSFPDEMESLALLTGHLCCSLLKKELAKMQVLPEKILITHPKPQYYEKIKQEIAQLGIKQIELLRDGNIYHI
ncbi:MAG: 3',5'-cyclic-nucleotide phosphodiesterase [Trichlorobacter sp.]|jgi:ribonuclease BN (tRNA processing enzyme)|nr:3',5'-cyclic-nucleotide phosphodiesterase [Trichlorobacter sp.]